MKQCCRKVFAKTVVKICFREVLGRVLRRSFDVINQANARRLRVFQVAATYFMQNGVT